jgi:WD40 repeat protein
VTPDGSVLACGYYDVSGLSLWSVPQGKQLYQLKQTQTTSGTTWHCAFSPNGGELAAVGLGLAVWDTRDATSRQPPAKAPAPQLLSGEQGFAGACFNAAGTELAFVAFPSALPHTPCLLVRHLEPDAQPQLVASNIEINPIQSLCFLPRSGRLAYVTRNRELAILEPETWRVLSQTPTLNADQKSGWYVANLTFSPDESRFAIVTPSGLGVELRDPATGGLIYTLPEESGAVWWLAWSPDSRQLAVSRDNGEIAVWNLQEVESQLARLGLKP